MSQKIIIVSNRLPLTIENNKLSDSPGGLARALASVFGQFNPVWVGWHGAKSRLTKKQIADLRFPDNLIPINLSAAQIEGYYNRISNGVLWPVLHQIEPCDVFSDADWQTAKKVNQEFARHIRQTLGPNDLIWIHDYHLVFLPGILRELGVKNKIGMFLHTPFSPPEHFLKVAQAKNILQSLSQLDLLGLQTERDVENIIKCFNVAKITAPKTKAFPIGIDSQQFKNAAQSEKVKDLHSDLKKRYTGKKVVLSVSRLDYTKGILEQFLAAEKVASANSNIKFISVVAPSREGVPEYKKLKKQIIQTTDFIKARLSSDAVELIYRNHSFAEVNALYQLADVLLVSPYIDGMNLVAKEYVAAKTDGALVLSSQAGAAFQLKDAVLVDPFDVEDVANGIEIALNLTEQERQDRWQNMAKNVKNQDVFWWANNFVDSLKKVKSDKTLAKN